MNDRKNLLNKDFRCVVERCNGELNASLNGKPCASTADPEGVTAITIIGFPEKGEKHSWTFVAGSSDVAKTIFVQSLLSAFTENEPLDAIMHPLVSGFLEGLGALCSNLDGTPFGKIIKAIVSSGGKADAIAETLFEELKEKVGEHSPLIPLLKEAFDVKDDKGNKPSADTRVPCYNCGDLMTVKEGQTETPLCDICNKIH